MPDPMFTHLMFPHSVLRHIRETGFRKAGAGLGLIAIGCLTASTAQAQFGGFSLPSIPRASSTSSSNNANARSSDGCPKGSSKSTGSSIMGSIIGQTVGRAASRAGISSFVPMAEVADTLTNAIACKLEPAEQKQAAAATLEATRGDKVGTKSTWTSQTRENVSGTSTVVARNDDRTTGAKCITVSDVIIVNGEETTANKRMCRPPGSARYSLMA
ncbi:hypothetical protein [Novosphingobium lentum]|uniref:hypothetical protein n=1 Tax=Novosphingobium lentum TaxID=145287 RepID=UPI000AFCC495|nr:hypothetical protein [Novosphingobium lentum]